MVAIFLGENEVTFVRKYIFWRYLFSGSTTSRPGPMSVRYLFISWWFTAIILAFTYRFVWYHWLLKCWVRIQKNLWDTATKTQPQWVNLSKYSITRIQYRDQMCPLRCFTCRDISGTQWRQYNLEAISQTTLTNSFFENTILCLCFNFNNMFILTWLVENIPTWFQIMSWHRTSEATNKHLGQRWSNWLEHIRLNWLNVVWIWTNWHWNIYTFIKRSIDI